MNELKQKLVDKLIEQIVADANSGDTTVLDEILMKCDNQVLVHSLPEEQWSEFQSLLPFEEDGISQDMIDEAEKILSDSDELTTLEAIKAIIARADEDPSCMIDNVEGVLVWEKREYTTTCQEFLEEIGYW